MKKKTDLRLLKRFLFKSILIVLLFQIKQVNERASLGVMKSSETAAANYLVKATNLSDLTHLCAGCQKYWKHCLKSL